MALAGDAQARYAHFRTLWGFAYPRSKIIFTGRPNYFLDDSELKSALNIERSVATGPYCDSLRLKPFDIPQMESALRSYPSTTRTEIVELARSNPQFREVASRGALLYAIGELWNRREGLGQYGSNINSAIVVGTFIRSTYDRQANKWRAALRGDKRARELADFMVLNSAERSYFMNAVACYMAKTGLPNQISSQDLQRLSEALYRTIPDEVSGRVSVASQEPNQPLRKRMEGADSVFESVVTDIRTCGPLVADPSQPGFLKFAHKSFMEYLVAEIVTDLVLVNDPIKTGSIQENVRMPISFQLSNPDILVFSAEILVNSIRCLNPSEPEDMVLRRRILGGRSVSFLYVYSINLFISVAQGGFNPRGYPRMAYWLLYAASCMVAGATISTRNPVERSLTRSAWTWLDSNLPHLTRSRTVESSRSASGGDDT
jgi:hypothetical protein